MWPWPRRRPARGRCRPAAGRRALPRSRARRHPGRGDRLAHRSHRDRSCSRRRWSSTCRVSPGGARRAARLARPGDRAAGGPVERAYRARGRRLEQCRSSDPDPHPDGAGARRGGRAPADCPFWMEPSRRVRRPADLRRPLAAEPRAAAARDHARKGGDERPALRRRRPAAARPRLRLAGASTPAWSWAAAALSAQRGGRARRPGPRPRRGGAVVYRHTLVNSYIEVEAGWLGTVTEGDKGLDHGIHIGAAFGARALRTRPLVPGAAIGASLERTFPERARPSTASRSDCARPSTIDRCKPVKRRWHGAR